MRTASLLMGLCVLVAAPPRAEAEPGRTAAPFLQRALGAQAAGMGNAFVAVPGRADAIQYNPAAAATLDRKTLSSTYLNGFGGTTHGFLGYAHPVPHGTLAAGVLYFNAGRIDLNLSDGTRGRVTAGEDSAWTLSYAARLGSRLSLGATYRFVRLELAETVHATTSQGDFGLLWKVPGPLRGLSAGAAYQYWGPDITFEEVGDPAPRTLRYGLAYHFPEVSTKRIDPSVDLEEFDMTLTTDVIEVRHEKRSPRLGVELGLTPSFMNRIAIRFGWVFERAGESHTIGVGLRHRGVRFDYAFGGSPELGNLQQLSLTLTF
ncbi:MAG: PorV/PorQ family protein [Elusimicrobiota bacterium]